MEIREDRWLSSIFNHGVFKIDIPARDHVTANICELIHRHTSTQSTAFYYAKVDTANVSIVRQLILADFYVVEVNVTFGLDSRCVQAAANSTATERFSIQEISPAQHEEVLDIAGSCFRYSRFHLDPLVPEVIANRIKREWIQNYINRQRGDRLFVASLGGQTVGFLAALGSESEGKSIRIIDLVGVSNSFQRQGVGQALVASFISHYKDHCDYLQVGTQVANIPSMRLYQTFGFNIIKTQYVMHMSIPDEKSG
jgi:ribosomal protein S18 acetylase RimI-like enzyme